ncbi:MAG: ester cyclase [Nitrososphaerota archaeon]|nr:ester cyclase [Nitrososphaerota archaeon]
MTSILQTKLVVESYLRGHDSSKIADDAVFVVMGTGQESKGQVAISQLLDYFYNKAFSARFDQKDLVVGEGKAVAEGDFVGKQNIEFAGIQPSGKEVHIPLLIKYDVKNGKITRANIYFETDVLRMQR